MNLKNTTAMIVLGVVLLALAVRLIGIGSFMTVDEDNWVLRSSEFYHKLFRNGDPGGTFVTTHPGATSMWLIGAGVSLQEQITGIDADTSNQDLFRVASTVPIAVVTALLVGVIAWGVANVANSRFGLLAGIVLAVEPYLVGMSQVAHLDMLMALLMLSGLLLFFIFLKRTQWKYLIASGLFIGLAMGVKLILAGWVLMFIAGYLLLNTKGSVGARVAYLLRVGGFVFGVAMLTFYLVWPALWVKDDLSQSFERDIESVATDAHVEIEVSEEPILPASFYARAVAGRTTPFVLILSAGAVVLSSFFVVKARQFSYLRSHEVVFWMFVYGLGYLALITLAAKKADRYALPALVVLPVLAGWVLSRVPSSRFWQRLSSAKQNVVAGFVFILLVSQVFFMSPYAIAYDNPFWNVRPSAQQGWGEGLDAAAAWLNDHPLADEMYVASWYPSVMETYFKGKTFSLSSRDDNRVAFVVLYRNMFGRAPDDIASNVIDEFKGKEPVHVVYIQGEPYAWIYNTLGIRYFTKNVGEILPGSSVGQLVPIAQDNWSAIDIGMATFSSRRNTQDVVLHVRESLESEEDLRTVTVNASEIEDSAYHTFSFDPISNSAGKTYYVHITSPTSRPGDAVTVKFLDQSIVLGEMVKDGVVFDDRDVAYRLP